MTLAVIAGALLAFRLSRQEPPAAGKIASSAMTKTPSIPEKSIAVLQFENLSSDKENAYFTDGIQDEILARLSKIADLKVISRTSTQHYKAAPENLPEIAQELALPIFSKEASKRAATRCVWTCS